MVGSTGVYLRTGFAPHEQRSSIQWHGKPMLRLEPAIGVTHAWRQVHRYMRNTSGLGCAPDVAETESVDCGHMRHTPDIEYEKRVLNI